MSEEGTERVLQVCERMAFHRLLSSTLLLSTVEVNGTLYSYHIAFECYRKCYRAKKNRKRKRESAH